MLYFNKILNIYICNFYTFDLNMKQFSQKIMTFVMTFVVLFSTMSFTIDMHYCGDTLVDTAIFQKVKTCGMEMQNPMTESCSISAKDCCSNDQIVIDGQEELKINYDSLTVEQQLFVTSFVFSYINLFEGLENQVTSYRDYIPPLVIKEIYKLDETYLI
jgi:hypothetical protein